MGAEELRMKTEDQLKGDLANLKKEAFNLRFQQANGQLENTARVRSVRRDIARINDLPRPEGRGDGARPPKPAAEAKPAPEGEGQGQEGGEAEGGSRGKRRQEAEDDNAEGQEGRGQEDRQGESLGRTEESRSERCLVECCKAPWSATRTTRP